MYVPEIKHVHIQYCQEVLCISILIVYTLKAVFFYILYLKGPLQKNVKRLRVDLIQNLLMPLWTKMLSEPPLLSKS